MWPKPCQLDLYDIYINIYESYIYININTKDSPIVSKVCWSIIYTQRSLEETSVERCEIKSGCNVVHWSRSTKQQQLVLGRIGVLQSSVRYFLPGCGYGSPHTEFDLQTDVLLQRSGIGADTLCLCNNCAQYEHICFARFSRLRTTFCEVSSWITNLY